MDKSGGSNRIILRNNQIILVRNARVSQGGKRGKIVKFSEKARAAMLRFINSAVFKVASFITLTYRYNMQNCKQAYSDLRAWYKQMVYCGGGCCVIWRREYQKRGAIHFHIFALDAGEGWTHEEMVERWLSVTGQTGDVAARRFGVDEKTFDLLHDSDAGVIVAYMAKYQAKAAEKADGKAWGIFGRKYVSTPLERWALYQNDAEAAGSVFVRAGAHVSGIANGGTVYNLYFGSMGVGLDAERRAFVLDFIAEMKGMPIEPV